MNTIHDPQSTYGLGSLKKLATRALLAGGLSVTAIGLGAGMGGTANASPAPSLTCPGYATPNGKGYVSFTNFDANVTVVVTDASTGKTINSGSPGPSETSVPANWPNWSPGWHSVNASEDVFVGPKTASCSVQVLGAAGGGMPPSPPAGGGATPLEPPGTCSFPPPPGGCHGINGPGRPKMAQ